jgi:carboxypeptidase D
MLQLRLWQISLIGVLLATAFSSRIDIARNRGFAPGLARNPARSPAPHTERASSNYRYRNDKTEDYFVESMPDIPQSFMTEMYSGLMPVEEDNPDRALFFVFQPRIGGPPVDEITIWMNGGPGCSSLEGFFQETGWIKWTWVSAIYSSVSIMHDEQPYSSSPPRHKINCYMY